VTADAQAAPQVARAAGVALIATATPDTVRVAAAVASGVAEYLHLGLEAAASLNAIAVEGSRNVVAHAYPAGRPGPLRMRIEPPPLGDSDDHEVTVCFQDVGRGLSVWPTPSDSPGIGLALVCELSERLQVTTRRGVGTSVEASVSIKDDFDLDRESFHRGDDPLECSLNFDDTALMAPVLPRALGAHIEGPGSTIDQIIEASRLGEAIAAGLASWVGDPPPILMPRRPDDTSAPLQVRVGPVDPDDAARLASELESSWAYERGTIHLSTSPAGDGALVQVDLDLG
jgi:anti-sigma regulatory factor (Ser/Thr protein kinase)